MCQSKLIKFNSGENEACCPEAVLPDAAERPTEVFCSSVSFAPAVTESHFCHFQVLCPDDLG